MIEHAKRLLVVSRALENPETSRNAFKGLEIVEISMVPLERLENAEILKGAFAGCENAEISREVFEGLENAKISRVPPPHPRSTNARHALRGSEMVRLGQPDPA